MLRLEGTQRAAIRAVGYIYVCVCVGRTRGRCHPRDTGGSCTEKSTAPPSARRARGGCASGDQRATSSGSSVRRGLWSPQVSEESRKQQMLRSERFADHKGGGRSPRHPQLTRMNEWILCFRCDSSSRAQGRRGGWEEANGKLLTNCPPCSTCGRGEYMAGSSGRHAGSHCSASRGLPVPAEAVSAAVSQ